MNETTNDAKIEPEKLVNKLQWLELEFDEASRPSLRWLDYQIAARRIPFIKIGAKIFFDRALVRASFARRNAVAAQ